MTSVVLPPDSEIVAPFSVSGVRLGSCALVEPSRSLMEEYGVVVGYTIVDAASRGLLIPTRRRLFCPVLPVWEN